MARITIRNLDEEVKTRLRVRTSANNRSMEEEARLVLAEAVNRKPASAEGLGTAIHELFKPFVGVEVKLPPREPIRDPPVFA